MKKTIVPLAAWMLSSCSGDLADLTTSAEAPLPSATHITPQEQTLPAPAAYRSANMHSPFQAAVAAVDAGDGLAAQPDFGRTKAPLERFALGELHMVGTLAGRGAISALIRDPQGRIHALRAGDHLSMDHGRIEAVHATRVDLIEMIRDGGGGWMQRARSLALPAASEEVGHES